jgi:hypothetical protein
MKTLTLYHGTNNYFDEFSTDFLSTADSIDQYGSGFYFYSVPSKTSLHGDLRITAKVEVNKIIDVVKYKKVSMKVIESLLLASPNFDFIIENFGETSYYGLSSVLRQAIKSYKNYDVIECLNAIGNDFYDKKDTHILLSKYAELTGYNAIHVKHRDIYVILTKKQITIESCVDINEEE